MYVNPVFKKDELLNIYSTFDVFQTMIFVFKKDDAVKMKEFLTEQGIKAEILIGGME